GTSPRSIGMPDQPTHVNIASTSDDWRGRALSNFSLSPFVFEGVLFASIEGFIHGIKFPESDPRRIQAFQLDGWDAKRVGAQAQRRGAYWDGRCLTYGSQSHQRLIEAAIRARIAQSTGLQAALLATEDAVIIHDTGQPESATTSLPGAVFCRVMTDIREELRRASSPA